MALGWSHPGFATWNWGSIPDWLAAGGTLIAAGVSLLVLREAGRIRKNELFSSLLTLWSRYNDEMFRTGFAEKYGDFYAGAFDEEKLTGAERHGLWSLINVLQYTWTLYRDGLMHEFYARHQVVSWFYGIKPKREFLIAWMNETNIDPEFTRLIEEITLCESLVEARTLLEEKVRLDRRRTKI